MPDEEQMRLPFPPQIVKKSNALCRARWSAESILEPRIIALVASKVNPDDDESLTYDIPVSDLFGKNYDGRNILELEAASEKLVSRTVKLQHEDGWGVYPLLNGCKYRKSTGLFTVSIHPEIRPHFLWFKDNILKLQYARYDLLEFLRLPSMYSQRIFEFLKSWNDKPERTEYLDNLHEMLGTPQAYRNNFKEFRTRVLERAHKDIHKHTSMRYTWTPIKQGRRVDAICFNFSGRRFGEQQLEDTKKKEAKALANSRKTTAAYKEAKECAREKGGVCSQATRAKRVCAICHQHEMREYYAQKTQ